jgi:YidC/Oxa1 family membrane protein insertase
MDWIKSIFSGNPILGWHDTLCFLSLPLILYVSQTVSTKILQPPRDPNKVLTEQEEFSLGLVNNLPFIVAFFSINVPAGLAVYWIVNNLLTTAVTIAIKSQIKDQAFPLEVTRMMELVDSPDLEKKISIGSSNLELNRRSIVAENRPKEGFGLSSSRSDIIDAEVVETDDGALAESEDESSDAADGDASEEGGTRRRKKSKGTARKEKRRKE